MRDYAQYTATPMKTKRGGTNNNNNLVNVTPSPASSAASFPNYSKPYNNNQQSAATTKSQVAVLNRGQQQHQQQRRDAASTASASTAATQSSTDYHSPKSLDPAAASHGNNHQQNQQQSRFSPPQKQRHQLQSPTAAAARKSPEPSTMSPTNHHHNSSSRNNASALLTAADALSLKRDGPEATIQNLRQSLEDAKARDEADKSNLAKSDATILELRSSVRQLKRQLEKLDGDARQKHQELVAAKQQLQLLKQNKRPNDSINDSSSRTSAEQEHAMAKEERVGELQVQLDRAHAQILTADMVRKELEDTLEAEQYTWELRVQDQERTIVELQQEIGVLAEDLEQCRLQWKHADEEWAKKVAELEHEISQYQQQQQQPGGSNSNSNSNSRSLGHRQEVEELHEKMRQLEEERNELQTCLDEALLELEAVDAELGSHTPAEVQQLRKENQRLQDVVEKQRTLHQQQQLQQGDQDFDTLEGLQHLYRWLLERGSSSDNGEEKKNDTVPQTSPELLDAIHHVLEAMPNGDDTKAKSTASPRSKDNNNSSSDLAQTVAELEAQLSVYRGDLQAREESSAELRASLKEAVALIKPLQDAVDKADQQKADLQQEVDRLRSDYDVETSELQEELQGAEKKLRLKEQECERLQHDIQRVQSELEDARQLAQARQAMHGLSPSAAAAAAAAQSTSPSTQPPTQELSSLSKARSDLKAKREQENTLRNLLRDAQNRFHTLNQQNQSVEAMNQQLQGRLKDAEEIRSRSAGSMEGLEVDVVSLSQQNQHDLEEQIAQLKRSVEEKEAELNDLRQQTRQPSKELTQKVQELEDELNDTHTELKKKQHSEKVLNKSLKEALGLLKPLQTHLEEAEEENKDLSQELRKLRRKLNAMEIQGMGTVVASPSRKSQPNSPSRNSQTPQGVSTPDSPYNRSDEATLREKQELEETVRQLEQENSQLHDALDEMSRMNNNNNHAGGRALSPMESGHLNTPSTNMKTSKSEARVKEELVELKSRYEVTQSRLEDAYVENHTLVEALKEKEESEKDAIEGMRILRERLRRTEMDLENAKYIATSALVKVEQAKSAENNMSMNSAFETESHTVHSLEEKAIELDLLAAAGIQPLPASPSRSANGYSGDHYRQQQHQQPTFLNGGNHQQHSPHTNNSWAGKRSRLADF